MDYEWLSLVELLWVDRWIMSGCHDRILWVDRWIMSGCHRSDIVGG